MVEKKENWLTICNNCLKLGEVYKSFINLVVRCARTLSTGMRSKQSSNLHSGTSNLPQDQIECEDCATECGHAHCVLIGGQTLNEKVYLTFMTSEKKVVWNKHMEL
jgi:hypothetical protein